VITTSNYLRQGDVTSFIDMKGRVLTTLPIQRSFKDDFGVEIMFYEWPVANPKAIIQIAHGLGEHARRYDHMAALLN
jgi:alpha-beta hydrolase superfamily lysophospholipase